MTILPALGALGFIAITASPRPAAAVVPMYPVCAPSAADLMTVLAGSFDTRRQFARAPSRLKVAPSVAETWLDRQYARVTRLENWELSPALFVEWRTGGPDGPVSRQRIWVPYDDACNITMAFYGFRKPVSPDSLPARGSDDLIAYSPECIVRWERRGKNWIGRLDPAECRIVAQSGRAMRLDVTIVADKDGFTYQEAGILDSGAKAFAVPPTMPYRFERLPDR